jgi:DNA primase
MEQVASLYGIETDRRGFAKCPFPFHQDKTGSLRIYQGRRGFACFGCNVSGSVIDFAMNLFKINFGQAIVRLSNDFGLGLTEKKPDATQIKKLKEQQEGRKRKEILEKMIWEWHLLEYKITKSIISTIQGEIKDRQAEAILRNADAEAWLDQYGRS